MSTQVDADVPTSTTVPGFSAWIRSGETGCVSTGSLRHHPRGDLNEAIELLSEAESPRQLIARVPMVLCRSGGFDRAMLSRVAAATWKPCAAHVVGDSDELIGASPTTGVVGMAIPLASSPMESTVFRRRRTLLVDRAAARGRMYAPLWELTRSRCYIVAPVLISGRAVGLLHADRHTSGQGLDARDVALAATFATLLDLVYGRLVALERLRAQQQVMTSALSEAADVVSRPQHLSLGRREGGAARSTRTAEHGPGRLTEREWEILGLMSTGATNSQIAAALIVSESTVKSHVKKILHKLPAANRAEAVYRYTSLVRTEGVLRDAI